ncbi:MAG: TetR/AcrR family transcriptional regulator [Actinomycetota bacterium]
MTRVAAETTDLPTLLCDVAAEVIAEKGFGGFSLREVARRAGVSHAAPGHHFGDLPGLLTELAIQGMQRLHVEMAEASQGVDDPAERLTAMGQAYVRVATAHPARAELAWRNDVIDTDDPRYLEAGQSAYGVLHAVIEAVAEAYNPSLPVNDAAALAWSSMQGIVVLRSKLAWMGEGDPSTASDDLNQAMEALVARLTPLMINGMAGVPSAPSAATRSEPTG